MRSVLMCCVTLVSLCCVDRIFGFIPNRLYTILLELDFTPATVDHAEITEDAILQVVGKLLLDNPNPDPDVDSTFRINSIDSITADSLIQAYYDTVSVGFSSSLVDAIKDIAEANSDVDSSEDKDAAAHFDSEQIQAGHNRLVDFKQMVINQIKLEKYDVARVLAGRMLHTLQDFYSHTNWVEMGRTVPYDVLGDKDRNPDNVVGKSEDTCSNCVRGEENLFTSLLNRALYHYRCSDNILPEVNDAGKLTSGYYDGQLDIDGNVIEKTKGKCSHGGFLDSSSDIRATGGINKDSVVEIWSPHASLHSKAVTIATLASETILNDIRGEVGDDKKFSSFLNIALDKQQISSIAYVIDTTGSMYDDILEIHAALSSIRMEIETYVDSLGPNAEVNLILVPFNDPDDNDSISSTTDIGVFLDAIADLVAIGGGDCPEPSTGATIRAIRASEQGSSIYVFTDAGPSDVYREAELRALIEETGVHISYVLTGSCVYRRRRSANGQFDNAGRYNQNARRNRRQSAEENFYSNIAAFSGGQVLNVQTSSISELSSVIFLSSELSFTEIYQRTGIGFISSNRSFSVDNTITVLLISLNGNSISSVVRTPDGNDATLLDPAAFKLELNSTNSFVATVNVTSIAGYGEWELEFTSSGPYSIQVSGLSSLGLTQQFYQLDTESNFGFSKIEGNPTKGQTLALLVTASGDYQEVELNSFDLLTSDGSIHQQFNLTKLSDKSYGSIFTPTLEVFQIALTGVDSSGNQVRRISGTGLQVSEVSLKLGRGSSHYNTLYPGNSSNVTVLTNLGVTSTFQINITHGAINSTFSYSINRTQVSLNQNETMEIIIVVTASANASNGDTVQFIVTASTLFTTDASSNYVSFQYIASTLPPPEFTINQTTAAARETANLLLLMFALTVLMSFIELINTQVF